MTILEIKTAAANYHGKTLAELTVGGQDLGVLGLNQARLQAELDHDFNFNRKRLTLSISTVTGGSLENAVIEGTATTVNIKTIIDIGTFDSNNNFIPQEWTIVEGSNEQQREDNRFTGIRYPSDGDTECTAHGTRRFIIRNNTIYCWPLATTAETVTIGIEASIFSPDWTANQTIAITGTTGVTAFNDTYYLIGHNADRGLWANTDPINLTGPSGGVLRMLWFDPGGAWLMGIANDLNTAASGNYGLSGTSFANTPAGLTLTGHGTVTGSPLAGSVVSTLTSGDDVWTKFGFQYLQWALADQLNRTFKTWVPRTEGNLPPPTDLASTGLEAFKNWDTDKYEAHRRHYR